MDDYLDELGGALGGVSGIPGLSGGASASSAATAISGAPINANTDFNFGSGSISDAPTIVATQSATAQASTATPPAQQPPITAKQPYYTVAAPQLGAPVATGLLSNKPLLIGGCLVALIALYIILK